MTPTSPAPIPIVYVETNWVVASVVTHDGHHKAARRLLEQAENGECHLRIPRAAVLESKQTVATVWNRPFKQLEDLRNIITKAYRHGAAPLSRIEAALESVLKESGVRAYVERDVESERVALLSNKSISQLADPVAEEQMMDALFPIVRLQGVDILDFYVLSAVLADRNRQELAPRSAIFLSTNNAEFGPGKKLSTDFWTARRMVYRSDFQLVPAAQDWAAKFGTPPNASP